MLIENAKYLEGDKYIIADVDGAESIIPVNGGSTQYNELLAQNITPDAYVQPDKTLVQAEALRDQLLAETDWTQLGDALSNGRLPNQSKKNDFVSYRNEVWNKQNEGGFSLVGVKTDAALRALYPNKPSRV